MGGTYFKLGQLKVLLGQLPTIKDSKDASMGKITKILSNVRQNHSLNFQYQKLLSVMSTTNARAIVFLLRNTKRGNSLSHHKSPCSL